MRTYLSERTLNRLRRTQADLNRLQPSAAPLALVLPDSPQPQDNLIVLPASFNPPTNAHLALLEQAQSFATTYYPDQHWQVYAAFSKQTIDKEHIERPLLLDRVELLRWLLHRHLSQVGIILSNRGLYVEQAEAMRASFPDVERLWFLVGFDKVVQIFDARYYTNRDAALEGLFRQAELLVAPRGDAGQEELETLLQRPENRRFAPCVHKLPFDAAFRHVSSTQVRQGQANALVPREVLHFMRHTQAYGTASEGVRRDVYEERIAYLRKHGIEAR
jgi:nicotinic acid mononucleotide adenylyltransferase